MNKTLEECANEVITHLRKGSIYHSDISMQYTEKSSRLSFNTSGNGMPYTPEGIESLFAGNEIRTCEFYDLGRSVDKALHVANFWKMLLNRSVIEVAKKMPFPKFKNHLYRMINVNIPEPKEVIVAPNVFMDYLYPQLITIKPGSFVGEEAALSTHYFTAKKFVIGNLEIGEDCLIGGRSLIFPGVRVGNGAEIGANTVISRDVDPGQKVRPCQLV